MTTLFGRANKISRCWIDTCVRVAIFNRLLLHTNYVMFVHKQYRSVIPHTLYTSITLIARSNNITRRVSCQIISNQKHFHTIAIYYDRLEVLKRLCRIVDLEPDKCRQGIVFVISAWNHTFVSNHVCVELSFICKHLNIDIMEHYVPGNRLEPLHRWPE